MKKHFYIEIIKDALRGLNPRKKKGFTLTEMMFVVLIGGFISIGLCNFMVDSAKALFTSTEKNDIANNIRQFTGEMETVAKSANCAYIYNSFNLTDRDGASDRMKDGQSGDCVFFVSMQADVNPLNADLITKVVAYFRRPDPTDPQGKGPVLKATWQPTGGAVGVSCATNTPEGLMSTFSYNGTYPNVVQLATGLSNGKLFYDFLDHAVMIKAEIYQGNNAKRITDTYNFTVSPKG